MGSMKRPTTEGLSDRDELVDDPKRIDQYLVARNYWMPGRMQQNVAALSRV